MAGQKNLLFPAVLMKTFFLTKKIRASPSRRVGTSGFGRAFVASLGYRKDVSGFPGDSGVPLFYCEDGPEFHSGHGKQRSEPGHPDPYRRMKKYLQWSVWEITSN